jgi:hypothetical protein
MTLARGRSWVEDFFMKNIIKVLGIIALATVIGLSFIGCDTGGGSTPAPAGGTGGPAGQATQQKTVYTWVAGEDSYSLEITEASTSRAAYTPKSGDTYVLTITTKTNETKRSSGAVTVSGNTFTLTPSNSSTTFTITVVKTSATNVLVTGMSGTITLDGGTETVAASEKKVTPVKVYETFTFGAQRWEDQATNTKGESWHARIPLSDFTLEKPEKGKKYTFRLSGTTDTEMKSFSFQMFNARAYPFFYQNIGHVVDYKSVKLSGSFDETFVAIIDADPESVDDVFGLNLGNALDENTKLPENAKEGDVMATFRNFRVSLLKIEFPDEG